MTPYIFAGIPFVRQRQLQKSLRYDEVKSTEIINAVQSALNISYYKLKSKSRLKEIVVARQIAMFHIRKSTNISLKEVGSIFNRDHSTVIHSVETYEDIYGFNDYFTKCADLVNKILYGTDKE